MKEYIIKLFEYDNFPLILGTIIIVLLIAFFFVLFLDKKSRKSTDTFKEESDIQKIEVEEKKEEDIPEEEEPLIKEEVEEPINEDIFEDDDYITDEEVSSKLESFRDIANSIQDELSTLERLKEDSERINDIDNEDVIADDDIEIELPRLNDKEND